MIHDLKLSLNQQQQEKSIQNHVEQISNSSTNNKENQNIIDETNKHQQEKLKKEEMTTKINVIGVLVKVIKILYFN